MYLIDGYNLLYQTNLETREELIGKISVYCRQVNKQALIVFDGYSPEDLSNSMVEVRFAADADQEIINIMKDNPNPTALTLVSSDKELIYCARQNQIKAIKSEHFNYIMPAAGCSSDDKPMPGGLSAAEVQRQLREFNYFKSDSGD